MLRVLFNARHELAESPVWDWRTSQLWWVDIFAGTVHSSNDDKFRRLPSPAGSIGLALNNQVVAATSEGVVLLETSTSRIQIIDDLQDELSDGRRANDGKVAPDGTFWFGTMAHEAPGVIGALYRTNAEGSTRRLVKDLNIPNGMDWSKSGERFYHTDTGTSVISRYRAGGVSLGNPDLHIDLSRYPGRPDGMTIDSDDNLWVCFWAGAALRKFSPEGDLLMEIAMPVSNPTSCTFGGEHLNELFITTATYGLTESQLESQPLAGSIFSLTTESTGRRAHVFG